MLYTDFKFLRGSERAELIQLIQECTKLSKHNSEASNMQLNILEDLLNSLEMKILEDDEFPDDYETSYTRVIF